MRKIKFKFWDKQIEEMHYQSLEDLCEDDVWFDGETYVWTVLNDSNKEQERFVIMQYTGFEDKNGKEIYEGDILGDWVEVDGEMKQSKLQVYFDEKLGQWMLDFSSNQDKSCGFALFDELQKFDYEVIGNIYENPIN